MQALRGNMIRLDVPAWFKDPDFQAWYNERLGKGLATWRHATDPLPPYVVSKEICFDLAKRLLDEVITADVLFEPMGVGSMAEIQAERQRLDEASDALDQIHNALCEAGDKDGLAPTEATELLELLTEKVTGADVLFEPWAIGDPDVLEEEEGRLETAETALNVIEETLRDLSNNVDQGDRYSFADCFVGVDPSFSGEGTDSDMPEKFWNVVVEKARTVGSSPDGLHVLVWISPTN